MRHQGQPDIQSDHGVCPDTVGAHIKTYTDAEAPSKDNVDSPAWGGVQRPWMSSLDHPSGIDTDVSMHSALIHEMPTQPRLVLILYAAIAMIAPPEADIVEVDVVARSAGAHLLLGILARYMATPDILKAMGLLQYLSTPSY